MRGLRRIFRFGERSCCFTITLVHSHLNNLRQVQRAALCRLGNLLLTTETICNNQCITCSATHGGQQNSFAAFDRYIVMFFLETESACHTATTRIQYLEIQAKLFEDLLIGLHTHDSLLVTVSVHQRLAMQFGRVEIRYFRCKKFTQQEGLLAEPPGVFIVGKEIEQFIAEDRYTAWLQANNGNTFCDLWSQRLKNLAQQPFGGSEHAKVIEWSPAAQGLLRDFDLVPGSFKYLYCSLSRIRVKIVVKGIGP